MNYAIIEDGIVVNIAVANHQVATNWILIPTGAPVGIGDTYDGKMFYGQNGNVKLTPETEVAQSRIAELEAENILKTVQIKALSDRNDFLEDCIVELAATVYA